MATTVLYVIMSGCLPLLMEWKMYTDPINDVGNRGASNRTWYVANPLKYMASVEESYPQFPSVFGYDESIEIDYDSFVVTYPGKENYNANFSAAGPTVEALMANTTELRRKQVNLMKHAPMFSFGLGHDAHIYDDAFHRILLAMGHYHRHNLTITNV
mmetsp:Transcript_31043/g.51282  ORF Transcript_31043/g.51282 Transcript_31043/m.51282 type:complete len:157 (-) Transcript_31043:1-471(-)